MVTNQDPILDNAEPLRVFYATGRMLGVDDFEAEQAYHRGRLARVLLQTLGSGTVSGLKVTTNGDTTPEMVELRVSAGLAIDRAGRLIDAPYMVCIRLDAYLKRKSDTELSDAFKAGALVADVFVSFVGAERGKTPSFATQDDYDATDAFTSNRMLDSFGTLLYLRKEADPPLPRDPWQGVGPLRAPGSNAADPSADALKQHLLDADAGPAVTPLEYPSDPDFDRTSVFLARVKIAATQSAAGARPTYDLTQIQIDNLSRLFLYPGSLLARWAGLTTGQV